MMLATMCVNSIAIVALHLVQCSTFGRLLVFFFPARYTQLSVVHIDGGVVTGRHG